MVSWQKITNRISTGSDSLADMNAMTQCYKLLNNFELKQSIISIKFNIKEPFITF